MMQFTSDLGSNKLSLKILLSSSVVERFPGMHPGGDRGPIYSLTGPDPVSDR